jgi:hypothetical protein
MASNNILFSGLDWPIDFEVPDWLLAEEQLAALL